MNTCQANQQIQAVLCCSSPTMQNITKTSLLALRLPVPPVKVQRALVKALTVAREKAVRLRAEAVAARQRTREEVERMVMGNREQNFLNP